MGYLSFISRISAAVLCGLWSSSHIISLSQPPSSNCLLTSGNSDQRSSACGGAEVAEGALEIGEGGFSVPVKLLALYILNLINY